MSAREEILERIRKAQGRGGATPAEAELAMVREAIARRTVGPIPAMARPVDLAAKFRAECDRFGTTHAQAATMAQVPGEVARYLDANGLARRIVAWHDLAQLDWAGTSVTVDDRPARADDTTGLTGCFCAIAETGSLLLLGAPATPKSTALLPETHIAVVSRSRLVATLEESFALLRREVGELPRATWVVSGPSRTADIEQTLVIGAHGPYSVHVIMVP